MYLCSCGATIELDKFYKLKEPLTLPFFRVIFMGIFVKKQGGGLTPPGKFQIPNHFGFWSYLVGPSIWPSFIEIGEMACITTAWSSHGHALNACLYVCTHLRGVQLQKFIYEIRTSGGHDVRFRRSAPLSKTFAQMCTALTPLDKLEV